MAESDLLSTLPPIIRRKIYRYLVKGAHILLTQSWKAIHSKYHENHPEDKEWEDPLDTNRIEADEWPEHLDNRILRTSHQINAEASALLFQESTFWVTYHISDLNRRKPHDLDIGDLEANLHRISDLTICIKEADDEPEYHPEPTLEDLASLFPPNADDEPENNSGSKPADSAPPPPPPKADEKKKGKKEKKKTTRGIAQLFERYAARCTALRRLTVRFDFEEAKPRYRDPQSKWRPMLEQILRSSAILHALASFAVRDEVVIKTNIMVAPFYTEWISEFVDTMAGWKGWEANSAEEGPTEQWVLTPKAEEEGEKRKVDIDEMAKEFGRKSKEIRAAMAAE